MKNNLNCLTDIKTCFACKLEKPISEFDINMKCGKEVIGSYCKPCRRIKNNARNKGYYLKNKDRIISNQIEKSKTPEYRAKQREYKKKQNEILTANVVATGLAKKFKTTTDKILKIDGLVESERAKLILKRKIKELEISDPNFKICTRCEEKKPIDDFSIRTENKKGKGPTSYRSGKCKKCTSEIKKTYGKK